ncbi:MAG TPA: hypothetical protein V6D47_12170 [Oscillatoriaceae cyanobacterium]
MRIIPPSVDLDYNEPRTKAPIPLQNRDTYQRSTGLLHNNQGGTRPLGGSGTRPLLDPQALRQQLEAILERGRTTIEGLEQRVEILLHGCNLVNVPVPGLGEVVFKHARTPKGDQLATYVGQKVSTVPDMAKKVRVVVFRFYDACNVAERVRVALEEDQPNQMLLEELRLKLTFLGHFSTEFKDDPVLSQMFPPPKTTASLEKAAPVSTIERLRQKQAREEVLHKAEILAKKLEPKIEIARLALQMIRQPRGLDMGSLFSPQTRTARLLALGAGNDQEVIAKLTQLDERFAKLQAELDKARKGGPVEPLKELLFPLGQVALEARKHVLLKDLFPFGEQDLFPGGGAERPS